jgi:hypothetical protein
MKEFLQLIGITVFVVAFGVAIFVGGGFLGLWWYPYQIKEQTAIVRGSNAYVTSQQDGINQMMVSYTQTKDPAQQKAITQQICAMSSELNSPQYLTPNENSFIQQNCP